MNVIFLYTDWYQYKLQETSTPKTEKVSFQKLVQTHFWEVVF